MTEMVTYGSYWSQPFEHLSCCEIVDPPPKRRAMPADKLEVDAMLYRRGCLAFADS